MWPRRSWPRRDLNSGLPSSKSTPCRQTTLTGACCQWCSIQVALQGQDSTTTMNPYEEEDPAWLPRLRTRTIKPTVQMRPYQDPIWSGPNIQLMVQSIVGCRKESFNDVIWNVTRNPHIRWKGTVIHHRSTTAITSTWNCKKELLVACMMNIPSSNHQNPERK